MDTATMVTTGQNWDIIGDILDAKYDAIQQEKKKKGSNFCGSCSGYFELPQEFPSGSGQDRDINVMGGSNYFENPKNFLDKDDINVFGEDSYLGSNYFESFEDYPAVMNDPNIYSFLPKKSRVSNFAPKDVRQACGGDPRVICYFSPLSCIGKNHKRKVADYDACAKKVKDFNVQQLMSGGGGSSDTTAIGGADTTAGKAGAPSTAYQQPASSGSSKTWIWIILAIVVIVVVLLLVFKGKKNKTK